MKLFTGLILIILLALISVPAIASERPAEPAHATVSNHVSHVMATTLPSIAVDRDSMVVASPAAMHVLASGEIHAADYTYARITNLETTTAVTQRTRAVRGSTGVQTSAQTLATRETRKRMIRPKSPTWRGFDL